MLSQRLIMFLARETNKKDGLIPAGILLNNGTILVGIGLISILVLKLRRKERYEN